jgi:hypothetical protein
VAGGLSWSGAWGLKFLGACAEEENMNAATKGNGTMKLIDTTPTYYTPEKAAEVVATLADADPDWVFTINADPSGKSPWVRVEVHDEDGEFVAFL